MEVEGAECCQAESSKAREEEQRGGECGQRDKLRGATDKYEEHPREIWNGQWEAVTEMLTRRRAARAEMKWWPLPNGYQLAEVSSGMQGWFFMEKRGTGTLRDS